MTDEVFRCLEELRENNVTILLVEQSAARTIEIADRTYVLQNGRVLLSGTRSEMERHEDLASLYFGSNVATAEAPVEVGRTERDSG
jgi:branched-chain amino acid transport system ATP-binding protein